MKLFRSTSATTPRESASQTAARKDRARTETAAAKGRVRRSSSARTADRAGQAWEDADRNADRGGGWRITRW